MNRSVNSAGFTLIELILVMALLATLMAVAAPSLSRSLRDRNLRQEATRFVALTEFARSEAVSSGIPMIVWVDAQAGRFGADVKPGFETDAAQTREYVVNPDVQFAPLNQRTGSAAEPTVIEFAADGTLQTDSIESLTLTDRFQATALIRRTRDAWGYEIAKEIQ